jgi:hypothetical protein
MRIRLTTVVILAATLTGCASQQWREENARCSNRFIAEIPQNIQIIPRTYTRPVQVPTGAMNCNTIRNSMGSNTSCTPVTRLEWVPYTTLEPVDLNAPLRQAAVSSCVAQACTERMGNRDCRANR